MEMPKRGSYSKVPRLLRKIGLKPQDVYLFNSLKEDEEVRTFMKTQLTHEECRLLKLGEKRRRRKYDPVVQPPSLSRWL